MSNEKIHWSITRAADWVIRLQDEDVTLNKDELVTLFTRWTNESKKEKKTPEDAKSARVKGAEKARMKKEAKKASLSDEEKYESKVLSQKKRAAKAKVGTDQWNNMNENEKEIQINEDHRKESMKEKTNKEKPKVSGEHMGVVDQQPKDDVSDSDTDTEKILEKKPTLEKKKPKSDKKKSKSDKPKSDKKEPKSDKPKSDKKEPEDSDDELDFE